MANEGTSTQTSAKGPKKSQARVNAVAGSSRTRTAAVEEPAQGDLPDNNIGPGGDIEKDRKYAAEVANSFMSFARVDLCDENVVYAFGSINPRPLSRPAVNKLADSFRATGIDRWNPKHAMPVAYPEMGMRADLAVKTVQNDPTNYPMLTTLFHDTTLTEITLYGGQHRYYAQLNVYNDAQKFIKDADAKESRNELTVAFEEAEGRLKACKKAELRPQLERAVVKRRADLIEFDEEYERNQTIVRERGFWLVEVYAKGTWHQSMITESNNNPA